MAIFMLLLLSGISILTLQAVRIHVKEYADSYNKEQAQLFLQSVIEAALLRIESFKRDKDCIQRMNFIAPDKKFEANVTLQRYYIFDKDANNIQNCSIVQEIATPQSNGYVLMNVVVSSTKNAKIVSPIRITKRTLQRP